MSAPVDVLAVMDQATRDCRDVGLQAQLHDAFATIAELIEAAEWMSAYCHADSGVDRVLRLRNALAAVSPK